MSPKFRPETTFSKVAGGRVLTADLQTKRLALNPLLHGGLTHVLPIFCACSFHGNSMNNLLSYCGLFDAKISASEKDLPVRTYHFEASEDTYHDQI